jgi:hypothetical protein
MPAIDAQTVTVPPIRLLGGGSSSPLFPSACLPGETDEPTAGIFAGVSQVSRWIAERFAFFAMWLVIACVSSVDTYLTLRFREELFYEELNPVARFLLEVDGWEPSVLIGSKFLGSILVLGFVSLLYSQNRRIGLIVTGAVAGAQLLLLAFLTVV